MLDRTTASGPALGELLDSAREQERAGAWDQALAHYEEALQQVARGGTATTAAELLRWIGTVHRRRGEMELAVEAYVTSRTIAEINELSGPLAAALNCLGAVEHQRGQVASAEALYERALELAISLDDQVLAASLDQNIGALHSMRGDLILALRSYESSLARGGPTITARANAISALSNMGMAHAQLQNWTEAESCLTRAAALAEDAGEMQMAGSIELNRGAMHLQRERFEAARDCCSRALKIFEGVRSKHWSAEAYKLLGTVHRETGRSHQADACLAIALGLAEVSQNRLLQAETQMEWASIHLAAQRCPEGILYLNRSLRLFTEMRATREVLDIKQRLQRMQSLYVQAVQTWSADLFAKSDPSRVDHARRVADLACSVATELGIGGWELTVVRVGALIHDIGHTAIPGNAAPSFAAAAAQRPLLRAHTIAGDAIARHLDFPDEIRAIVRSHHEREDGSGYPDAYCGDEIPLLVQAVAISDQYDRHVYPTSNIVLQPTDFRDFCVGFSRQIVEALERVVLLPIADASAA